MALLDDAPIVTLEGNYATPALRKTAYNKSGTMRADVRALLEQLAEFKKRLDRLQRA